MSFIYQMNLIKLAQEGKLPDKWIDSAESMGIPASKDKTPLNVNLIPEMTSNTVPAGTCGASGVIQANTENMVTNSTYTEASINQKAYIFFNSTVNANSGGQISYVSENKTNQSMTFWYLLDSSQYNKGYFDPGVYYIKTEYGSNGSNMLVSNYVLALNENDEWITVGSLWASDPNNNYDYPNSPYTCERTITVNFKFKGIKIVKTNKANYNHTRKYYRYGTQLIRLSKI